MTVVKRPGRPRIERADETARVVTRLAGMGLPVEDIATAIGMARHTMVNLYGVELEVGRARASAAVAGSLYRAATHPARPSVVACIFWLKARAGWRDGGPAS